MGQVWAVQRSFRLTGSADFKRVRQFGRSFPHPLVVLVVQPNELEKLRVAVAAGRSVGNAVARNRAKRVIRAAMQPLLAAAQPGWDLLLIARRPIAQSNSQETQTALEGLLRRARLLSK